jgi:Ras-related protein Rab-1A
MTSANDYDYLFKVLIVGNSGVGKSCLLLRFAEDLFSNSYISTIGVDFKIRRLDLEGTAVKMQIWDTAGQERFHTITKAYYRGSNGVIIVYDVSDRESFDRVQHWITEIDAHASTDICRLLVGNKADLFEKRVVKTEEGAALARQFGLPFIEASAKECLNVDGAFTAMASAMKKKASGFGPDAEKGAPSGVLIYGKPIRRVQCC